MGHARVDERNVKTGDTAFPEALVETAFVESLA